MEDVMSLASPLRDRSNEEFAGRRKRLSRGGDDKRQSCGGDEKVAEDEKPQQTLNDMISFEEMRKQLSLWQSKFSDLSSEQIEAEKLRQDSTSLREKLSSCEVEASDRARRLAQTRVQVQETGKELAEANEKLNRKFQELVQEKEVTERQSQNLKELSDMLKDAERKSVALEAESAALRAELAAEKVHGSRLKTRNAELQDELATVAQAGADAQVWVQTKDAEVAELRQEVELQKEEIQRGREAQQASNAEAQETISLQQAKLEEMQREILAGREGCDAEHMRAQALEADLSVEAERAENLEQQLKTSEKELETVRADLQSECEKSREQQHEITKLQEEATQRAAEFQAHKQELEAAQELVARQQELLEDRERMIQSLRTEQEQTVAETFTQHEKEVEMLEQKIFQAQEEAYTQKAGCAKDLEFERSEVARLHTLEASLRLALEGQCEQLAESAREHEELRQQLQQLQEAQTESRSREETLELQLERAAQASGAESSGLKSEVSQLSETMEATKAEVKLWRERAEALVRRRKAAAAVASRWQGADAAWDWLLEQGEAVQELQDLPEGSELRLQNRELCLSLRQFKQDNEVLEANNLSLKQALTIVEEDLDRVTGHHADLMGHTNHRQKIRYTMKLKEETNRLCGELKKARQRMLQLEMSKESESLFEALASVVGTQITPSPTLKRRPPASACTSIQGTPRPSRPAAAIRRTPGSAACAGMSIKSSPPRGQGLGLEDFEDQMRLEEAERRCEMQQHALERISVDFQHLKALIERAVLLADTERRKGVSGGNFAMLLQRLREIIAANSSRHGASSVERDLGDLPIAATPMHGDDDSDLVECDNDGAPLDLRDEDPAEELC
eukprot:CAMPEP_0197668244 /NCGR_PEP_ID=MMETSP1338-20131121/68704_1 /TAXON_ID=43686 ORGANISM="Pelagodinium beii, Strain RCC1491" /NCGR_SAMPLE_ID=MMETSP1338 /ASSEMBLY_ACC=CAM_ASM_000754 /LENGTH=857 /DNA_ID=CAMNT_0043247633 /DNA_START=62 /DNA_END=2635 /DNA_ORIENTATION=-